MKPITSKTLTNITKERMGFIRQQGQIRGIDLKGDTGDIKYDHCVIHYTYDEKAQTLTINPSVPFYVTDEQFWGHLHDALGEGDIPAQVGSGKPTDGNAANSQVHNPSAAEQNAKATSEPKSTAAKH